MKTNISGKRNGSLWDLEANVTKGTIRLPDEPRHQLHGLTPLEDVVFVDDTAKGKTAATSAGHWLQVRLAVRAPETLRVRRDNVDVTLDVELVATYLKGTTGLHGTVEIVRGQVKVMGQRFDVVHALATYEGTMPPNPRIEVRLSRDYGDITVYIVAKGKMSDPKYSFESDPPGRDKTELIALVMGRAPRGQQARAQSLEDRASAAASTYLFQRVQHALQGVLPIDVLRIEPGGTEDKPVTQVTVGRWVTDDLYVVARSRAGAADSENAYEVEVRYAVDMLGKPTIEALYGDKKQGVDLVWVFEF